MPQIFVLLQNPSAKTIRYLLGTAIIGIALGLVMLIYPSLTMTIASYFFRIFQVLASAVILYFALTQAIRYFKQQNIAMGIAYLVPGLASIVLIWLIHITILNYAMAFILTVCGISEIIAAFLVPMGKFFLILLAFVDLVTAWLIIQHPVLLAILFAWYVFFWGVSRLMFSLELKKSLSLQSPSPIAGIL